MLTRAPRLVLLAALACTPTAPPTAPAEPPVPQASPEPPAEPPVPQASPEPPAEPPAPQASPEPAPAEPPVPQASPEPPQGPDAATHAPPAAKHGRVPVVRREPVTVGPSYSSAAILRVVRRADFSRCGATRPPATYSFTIAADGTVTSAEAHGADGQASTDPAHRCALEVLRGLTFPAGVGTLHVRYPLR